MGWEEGGGGRETLDKRFGDLVVTPPSTEHVSEMPTASIQPNLTFTGYQGQQQEGLGAVVNL